MNRRVVVKKNNRPNAIWIETSKMWEFGYLKSILPKHKHITINRNFSSLEKITKIIFNQRRKMIKTSLKQLDGCNILSELKISPLLRPEQLSIEDFCRIAKKVFEN